MKLNAKLRLILTAKSTIDNPYDNIDKTFYKGDLLLEDQKVEADKEDSLIDSLFWDDYLMYQNEASSTLDTVGEPASCNFKVVRPNTGNDDYLALSDAAPQLWNLAEQPLG